MNAERQKLIKKLEEITNCDIYILFTASGEQEYSVSYDFLPLFTESIFMRRNARRQNAILILETNGGDPTTAMAIVKQLHENYKKIFGYAFNRCFSAGTVGMFATDEIHMSRYALLTPVDLQCFITDEANYKPVIANYNAFVDRKPDAREEEFAQLYPVEYLTAIRTIRYSMQTMYPNFARHCKPSSLETTWDYFNGGAGLHSSKISRTQAIKDFGIRIKTMPEEIEEILYNIIDSYIKSTNMLIDSLDEIEVKDAYFETLGLTYVHYAKYQQQIAEEKRQRVEKESDVDKGKDSNKKPIIEDKYCIEIGWKKE